MAVFFEVVIAHQSVNGVHFTWLAGGMAGIGKTRRNRPGGELSVIRGWPGAWWPGELKRFNLPSVVCQEIYCRSTGNGGCVTS